MQISMGEHPCVTWFLRNGLSNFTCTGRRDVGATGQECSGKISSHRSKSRKINKKLPIVKSSLHRKIFLVLIWNLTFHFLILVLMSSMKSKSCALPQCQVWAMQRCIKVHFCPQGIYSLEGRYIWKQTVRTHDTGLIPLEAGYEVKFNTWNVDWERSLGSRLVEGRWWYGIGQKDGAAVRETSGEPLLTAQEGLLLKWTLELTWKAEIAWPHMPLDLSLDLAILRGQDLGVSFFLYLWESLQKQTAEDNVPLSLLVAGQQVLLWWDSLEERVPTFLSQKVGVRLCMETVSPVPIFHRIPSVHTWAHFYLFKMGKWFKKLRFCPATPHQTHTLAYGVCWGGGCS